MQTDRKLSRLVSIRESVPNSMKLVIQFKLIKKINKVSAWTKINMMKQTNNGRKMQLMCTPIHQRAVDVVQPVCACLGNALLRGSCGSLTTAQTPTDRLYPILCTLPPCDSRALCGHTDSTAGGQSRDCQRTVNTIYLRDLQVRSSVRCFGDYPPQRQVCSTV